MKTPFKMKGWSPFKQKIEEEEGKRVPFINESKQELKTKQGSAPTLDLTSTVSKKQGVVDENDVKYKWSEDAQGWINTVTGQTLTTKEMKQLTLK